MSYLKADLNFGLPIIIVLGMIFSVWTNSFFFYGMKIAFHFNGDSYDNKWFYYPILMTHFIITLATCAALYAGFKISDLKLIQLWMRFKVIECVGVATGAIMVVADFRNPYMGQYFFFIGLMILAIGYYLWKSVKVASISIISSDANVNAADNKVISTDAPPPYTNVQLEQNIV